MKQKIQILKKRLILLSLLAVVFAPFSATAQLLTNRGTICIAPNGSFNLKQEKLKRILTDVCYDKPLWAESVRCEPNSRFTFQVIGGGVIVDPNTGVVTSTSTEKATVVFNISYVRVIELRQPNEDEINDPLAGIPENCRVYCEMFIGQGAQEITIRGSLTGYFEFHKTLPDIPVEISGSRCFTDTISLRTNSDFQHFVNEWEVFGNGLNATSPIDEWAVSYERLAGADNQFTVRFTVTDVICGSGTKYVETVIGTRTILPTIDVLSECVPICTTTLTVSARNPYNYNFFWSFRTNNDNLLPMTNGENSATFDIGRYSGHVVLTAWGICDTVSTEVLINRSLSQATQIWVDEGIDPSCIFRGDTLYFSVYPTLEEHVLWSFPANWEIISEDTTSGTIRAVIGENGHVEVRSRACPDFIVRRFIYANESNVTLTIDGLSCRIPGTTEFYSVAGLPTADMFIWRFDGSIVGDGEQISFRLPADYRGNFGQDSLRVTATKCNREFTVAIPIFVQFTEELLTIENPTCAFVGDEIRFFITPEINENITWIFDNDNLTLVNAERGELTLTATNSGIFQISAQNKFCTERGTTIASTPINILDIVTVEILSDFACLSPGATYTFEVAEIADAIYVWTTNLFAEPIVGRSVTISVPSDASGVANIAVTATLCYREFTSELFTPGLAPQQPTIVSSRNCTHRGMEDELRFWIDNVDATATSYRWTVTDQNGIDVPFTETGNYRHEIKVVTDGAKTINVSVVAYEYGCGESIPSEIATIKPSGIGGNYSLSVMSLGGGEFIVMFDVLTIAGNILWFINDQPSDLFPNQPFFPVHREQNAQTVSAVVSTTDSACKTKFTVEIPQ